MKFRKGIILFLMVAGVLSCTSIKNSTHKEKVISRNQLSQDERNQFDYYFFDSQRLKDFGKIDEQIEALRMCLSIDSLNGAVQSEYGLALVRLNKLSQAREAFNKSVELYPENWWYRYQYITLLASQGMYEEAVQQAEILKKYFPQRDFVYTLLSSLYKETGEYEKAIDALNQLEQFMGVNETLSFEKFQIYSMLNKESKAIAEIDRLVEKYPKISRYKVLRGDIFMEKGQADKAFDIYQTVLIENPENPFVYVSLAEYYNKEDKPEKAFEAVSIALKNPKLPSETKMEILGQYVDRLLMNNKRIEETEELFQLLIDMYPLEEMPHAYYALFLQKQKRQEEALEELETIISLNPKNEGAWKNYLQILILEEDTTKILDFTERALKHIPQVPEIYFYRSVAQFQQKNYEGALESSKLAIENTAKIATPQVLSGFYGQIGDIYFQMKDRKKAFENYDKALELSPNNVYVMNNYAYYLSLEKKDLRRAERMSSKTVELEPGNSTYLDTYAWILYEQGDYSLAKIYIDRAISNLQEEGESEVIYDHAGDIYAALNKYEEAIKWWTKGYECTGKTNKSIKKKIEDAQTKIKNEN